MNDEVLCNALRYEKWDEAADRIEALTAKVKLMDDLDVINGEKIEALTAELAKAVEALREIASEASVTVHTHNKGGINYTRMYEDWRKLAVKRIDKARDTLAEIEGEKG